MAACFYVYMTDEPKWDSLNQVSRVFMNRDLRPAPFVIFYKNNYNNGIPLEIS